MAPLTTSAVLRSSPPPRCAGGRLRTAWRRCLPDPARWPAPGVLGGQAPDALVVVDQLEAVLPSDLEQILLVFLVAGGRLKSPPASRPRWSRSGPAERCHNRSCGCGFGIKRRRVAGQGRWEITPTFPPASWRTADQLEGLLLADVIADDAGEGLSGRQLEEAVEAESGQKEVAS